MTFVAGHPTLDLVNTVAWRLDPARREDRLPTGATLARWVGTTGLPTDDAWWSAALGPVTRLRERLTRVLVPLATGTTPPEPDLVALRRTLTAAMRRAELTTVVPPQWAVEVRRPRDLADRMALGALGFLAEVDPARLRQCADDACGWLFVDHSRNNSRRWCDSADCGNRNRVKRHHQRVTAGASTAP
jgi:predicted RNA-binding Zn ribbon-like protein